MITSANRSTHTIHLVVLAKFCATSSVDVKEATEITRYCNSKLFTWWFCVHL